MMDSPGGMELPGLLAAGLEIACQLTRPCVDPRKLRGGIAAVRESREHEPAEEIELPPVPVAALSQLEQQRSGLRVARNRLDVGASLKCAHAGRRLEIHRFGRAAGSLEVACHSVRFGLDEGWEAFQQHARHA